jgi:hypothetical protein
MRNSTRLLIGLAFATGGATMACAQATPVPGAGDSTQISNANRENGAAYNKLIGATNAQPRTSVKVQQRHPSAVPATAADIVAGARLRDIKGVPIGTIVSADGTQAIVDTGQTKIGVPLIGFGKDDQGLVLNMTADRFNQLVAQAHARSAAPAPESN